MNPDVGKEFMEKTKNLDLGESDQSKGLPQPPLELPYDKSMKVYDLPAPATLRFGSYHLGKAITERKSLRAYSDEPLTLEELSWLLWCTQGVKEVIGWPATLRTVPSAGARHAFETYLLINRVEGLEPGLYRFIASEHKLVEENLEEGLVDKLAATCGQNKVKSCAATFIWVVVTYRMAWRYQERGYRYLHLDAGHVCQNLYLSAEAIGGGACAIGAFHDDEINRLLGIDGEEQFVIYVAPVGKKA